MRTRSTFLLILTLGSLGFASPEKRRVVRGVPGVSLVPPAGFDPELASFRKPGSEAAILVGITEKPWKEAAAEFSDEALVKSRMIRLAKTESGPGWILLHVSMLLWPKSEVWIFAFEGKGNTIMVFAAYPRSKRAALRGPMRRAARSARYDPAAAADPSSALDFTIGKSKSFAQRSVIGFGTLQLTRREYKKDKQDSPLVRVFKYRSAPSTPKKRKFEFENYVRKVLGDKAHVAETLILRIGGLEAYECDARLTRGKTRYMWYFAMVFDTKSSYVFRARTTAANRARDRQEFRRLARTLRVRDD